MKTKRILSLLLTAVMIISLCPEFKITASAAGIQNNLPTIRVNQRTNNTTKIGFGGYQWYVIGYNGNGVANSQQKTMTLLSVNAINAPDWANGGDIFNYKDVRQDNEYITSHLRDTLTDEWRFTDIDSREREIMVARILDEVSGENPTADKLWALSISEATAVSSYLRILGQQNSGVPIERVYWWLRSPGSAANLAAYVFGASGNVNVAGTNVANVMYVRPACILDLSSVLFVSDVSAGSGKSSAVAGGGLIPATSVGNNLKFTVLDRESMKLGSLTTILKDGDTVHFSYTGATAGATLSAVVVNNISGAVRYYGKLKEDITASGTASVTIPGDLGENESVQIFVEETHGGDYTDFASEYRKLNISGFSEVDSDSALESDFLKVHFGNANSDFVKWYVTKYARDTVTLWSSANMGDRTYDSVSYNNWRGSDICAWLNGTGSYDSNGFLQNTFSQAEQNAIAKYGRDGTEEGYLGDGTEDDEIDLSQKIVLPSVEEIGNGYGTGTWNIDKDSRALGDAWWLRSPGTDDNLAAAVDGNTGEVNSNGIPVNTPNNIYPALKLDLSSVLFTSNAINDTKSEVGNAFSQLPRPQHPVKLTVLDSSLTLGSLRTTAKTGNVVSFNYSGATPGKALSAVVLNNSGAVKHYIQLASNIPENGTASITLPVNFEETDTVQIFVEQLNGSFSTDFASSYVRLDVGEVFPFGIRLGSTVYYGTYPQSEITSDSGLTENTAYTVEKGKKFRIEPIGWRVLENTDGKALLLSEKILEMGKPYNYRRMNITWERSTIRAWLNGYTAEIAGSSANNPYSYSFIDRAFNDKEQSAILNSAIDNSSHGGGGEESIADTEDRIFFLSLDDAKNTAYGFSVFTGSYENRVAKNTAYAAQHKYSYGTETADWWWLRSSGCHPNDVVVAGDSGRLYGDHDNWGGWAEKNDIGVRPAFNLDLSSLLFTSDAVGGKSGSVGNISGLTQPSGAVKLTVLDKFDEADNPDGQKVEIRATPEQLGQSGAILSLSYSGATTGINQYISCILERDGYIEYYGKLAVCATAGWGNLQIPIAGIANGTYTLKVFSEQSNGDYYTDYAGEYTVMTLTVSNGTGQISNFGGIEVQPVTFTAVQTGGASGIADSTGIEITFSQPVTGLTADNIIIVDGTGKVYKGGLSGSGNVWTIAVSAVTQGYVTVIIPDFSTFKVTTVSEIVYVYKDMRLPPNITSSNGMTLTYGTGGSFTVTATGVVPIAYSLTGDVPNGVRIDSLSGVITVDSTVNAATYHFTITAANVKSPDATQRFILTVNKAAGSFGNPAALNAAYTPTLTLTDLKAQLPDGYSWADETTAITNAGDGQSFNAKFNHPSGNYTEAIGTITVNVLKSPEVPEITAPSPGSIFPAITAYMVTFETNGGNSISRQSIAAGGHKASKPADPQKDGFEFAGWYSNRWLTIEYDFNSLVTGNLTLYAKWTRIGAGTPDNDGKWINPFADVNENDWFYSDIEYVHANGIFKGTGVTTFSPAIPMTRAMIVTVLWRIEGSPSASGTSFRDVPSGQYYSEAVAWAESNGITVGIGDNLFSPHAEITREQMAAFLWRYAKFIGIDVSADADVLIYNDISEVSGYAVSAIQWACGAGIILGKPEKLLDPKGKATRAEVAAMLHRFSIAQEI